MSEIRRSWRAALVPLLFCASVCLVLQPGPAAAEAAPNTKTNSDQIRAKRLAEACARVTCRTEVREVRFKTRQGETIVKTELVPYVDQGSVVLYPGEAIEIDFAADGSSAGKPQFVRVLQHIDSDGVKGFQPPDPSKPAPAPNDRARFSLELRQDGTEITLLGRSDLDFTLKYDALMFVPTRDGLKSGRTTTCPVLAGAVGHENWPYPVAMLLLTNFRVAPPDTKTCD